MPITVYSLDDLEAQALAVFRARFTGWDLSRESFLGKQARAFALLALGLEKSAKDVDNDATPNANSSAAALDMFAVLFGLPNGVGGYGRKGAVAAAGGAALCTGTNGTAFADGALLTAPDGVTQLKLSGSVTIAGSPPGTGSIAGIFVAVTPGSAGNLDVGTVLSWVSTPSGGDATVKLTAKISGGLDSEKDSDLLTRILQRLQNPPKGGTSADFRGWAEGVSGVLRAFPYPLRAGLGSLHAVIVQSGSGLLRAPSAAVQTAVDNAVNGTSSTPGLRTVTAQGYKTLLPYQPLYPTGGLTIRLRVRPAKTKYNFDWDDTAGWTVDLYSPGAGAGGADTLRLQGIAPATLKAAVDAGLKPRLQILSTGTGAPAVPVLVYVTAYADGGGKTTLTLQNPLPTGYVAPNFGDTVYAGASFTAAMATAVLAYLDALGPSRLGGYADPNDSWDDTADTGVIGQVARDVLDTDGSRFIKGFVQVANVNQITIAVGNGAATTGNVSAGDATASGPELLYARFIAVTQ